jgi:hypothetical protein
MDPQNHESPSCGNAKMPKTKCHLDVGLLERHKEYYKGEGGGFPQVWAMMSLVSSRLPMTRPSTKNVQIMH